MTIVILLQVLVGTLAGLLLLEAWLRRHEVDRAAAIEIEAEQFVEFHPELLVRWDDEAGHGRRQRVCTRTLGRRESRQLADAARRRSFDR